MQMSVIYILEMRQNHQAPVHTVLHGVQMESLWDYSYERQGQQDQAKPFIERIARENTEML